MKEELTLKEHLSQMSRKKWRKIRAGELPPSAGGGRPVVPTSCPRCGELQPSAGAADKHCRKARRGRPRKKLSVAKA